MPNDRIPKQWGTAIIETIAQWSGKIDVISISSPDHTHAHATQLALKAGMQVFVQSPMAHTVWEARQLRILAKEMGACVQVGMQGCAHDGFRQGVEYLQAGGIGQVSEIHVWTNQPTWPQGPIITDRPNEHFAVPDELNWDGFLGPSQRRGGLPSLLPTIQMERVERLWYGCDWRQRNAPFEPSGNGLWFKVSRKSNLFTSCTLSSRNLSGLGNCPF